MTCDSSGMAQPGGFVEPLTVSSPVVISVPPDGANGTGADTVMTGGESVSKLAPGKKLFVEISNVNPVISMLEPEVFVISNGNPNVLPLTKKPSPTDDPMLL